jgi:hypothetical protein
MLKQCGKTPKEISLYKVVYCPPSRKIKKENDPPSHHTLPEFEVTKRQPGKILEKHCVYIVLRAVMSQDPYRYMKRLPEKIFGKNCG